MKESPAGAVAEFRKNVTLHHFLREHELDFHRTKRSGVDALATPSPEWSVVKIGRAFVLLDGIAAVDDDHLAGDVGCGFAG